MTVKGKHLDAARIAQSLFRLAYDQQTRVGGSVLRGSHRRLNRTRYDRLTAVEHVLMGDRGSSGSIDGGCHIALPSHMLRLAICYRNSHALFTRGVDSHTRDLALLLSRAI